MIPLDRFESDQFGPLAIVEHDHDLLGLEDHRDALDKPPQSLIRIDQWLFGGCFLRGRLALQLFLKLLVLLFKALKTFL